MRQQREGYLGRLRSVYRRKCAEFGPHAPVVKELRRELLREAKAVKYLKYYHAHSSKVKARAAVSYAIVCGDLFRPSSCSRCGTSGEVEAHHWSYKPEHRLDVEWLCPKCHRQVHEEVSNA